jgi:acyl-[acyl-carrier-protein] desaturase
MKFSELTRLEVLQHLDGFVAEAVGEYLKLPEQMWQPADHLPDAATESFFDEVKQLQERAKALPYDLLAVLIGDMITEEALPTYESWLYALDDVAQLGEDCGWRRWTRAWTAEENRHGDLLNKYLYLSGRVNMREVEASTQYLISDGFNIETGHDPYRNFIYTSFQEVATNISHRRVASLAKKEGDSTLAKICGLVAADEARHAKAYQAFISKVFEVDPNEAILAFEDMMRKKIVMPAHFLREIGTRIGETYGHFTNAAQRLGVYTAHDYVEIVQDLLKTWRIEYLEGLNPAGEKARDYLVRLPDRLLRVAERMKLPELEYKFRWILA